LKLLLDTQLLLWAVHEPARLSDEAKRLFSEPANDLFFSAASLWETAIKSSLGRADFDVDPQLFRHTLLADGFLELAITSEHAVAVGTLPMVHKDPFDRMLLAQAIVEGLTLLTADEVLARYAGPVRKV
jgi:PIN domain nuclease of toxin-antitoxin system